MLEDHLPLVPVKRGRPLPSPKHFSTLEKNYLIGASIKAHHDKLESANDLGKVLTLKPVALDTTTIKINNKYNTVRGYFAWGELIRSDERAEKFARFDIYAPPRSLKNKEPSADLEKITGLFTVRLIQEGYSIESESIEFFYYI